MYQVADELAVRALAEAYTDAVNRRDADGMAAIFAPNGVIEKPGFGDPVSGIAKIKKRYQRLHSERDFLFQMTHSGVVEFDAEDRARARWWFSEVKKTAGDGPWLQIMGVYQDEAVRLDEGWRFTRRSQTTLFEQHLSDEAIEIFQPPSIWPITASSLTRRLGGAEL
ncbi:MAG: hypothetical protein ACI9GB_001761 [Halioglobus sp.]|jgi:hypothetical protein